jgi:pSer/pThr/pTyr-binding forkhead associated (FHA) protein
VSAGRQSASPFGTDRPCSYLRTGSGHRVELRPNRVYFLGRAETCDVRVDDSGASRRHAKISVAGDPSVVYVEDLDSKNGTWRNEAPLKGRVQLADGDCVRIGTTEYRVQLYHAEVELELDTRTTVLKDGK